MESKLIKNCESINNEKITLFCLPYAGGGASAYNQWMTKMQDRVVVCPIQLPGREERIMEKPYTDMKIMLEDLVPEIENTVKGKYALWGHSMGGKIAYEVEKHMERDGYQALCLFVSGTRVPSIPEPNPIYRLPNVKFKKELERFEGTPREILENHELLDFFLPMLRADFTMNETYYDDTKTILHTPIIASGGNQDKEADDKAIREWEKYTDNEFEYKIYEGGHFYIRDNENEIIKRVISFLMRNENENKTISE